MKKILITLFFATLLFTTPILATDTYTIEDVSTHNSTTDCWMIYADKVYDLTTYISNHDRFMDIREWCGLDMTEDFETKAGSGRDHKTSSYSLLANYEIGTLITTPEPTITYEEPVIEKTIQEEVVQEKIVETNNPYNLLIPLVLTSILYWASYFVFKKKLKKFNAFWNTILLLTLVIPSFGFGIFMMLRYQFPKLYDLNFEFMYWHVELSVVMGVIGISHLIQRLKMYLLQLGK